MKCWIFFESRYCFWQVYFFFLLCFLWQWSRFSIFKNLCNDSHQSILADFVSVLSETLFQFTYRSLNCAQENESWSCSSSVCIVKEALRTQQGGCEKCQKDCGGLLLLLQIQIGVLVSVSYKLKPQNLEFRRKNNTV